MSIASRIGKNLAPSVTQVAPGLTSAFVHEALDRAINGVGPLPARPAVEPAVTATERG